MPGSPCPTLPPPEKREDGGWRVMQPSGGVGVNPEGTADGVRVGTDKGGPRAQLWGALPHENAPRTKYPSLGEEIS